MAQGLKIMGVMAERITIVHIQGQAFKEVTDVTQEVVQHRSAISFNHKDGDTIRCATVWEDFILGLEQPAVSTSG